MAGAPSSAPAPAPAPAPAMSRERDRRARDMVTPEGVALPMVVATRGSRALALLLDLAIILLVVLVLMAGLVALGLGIMQLNPDRLPPGVEAVAVLAILLLFLARFGYFLWFELGPRGATPGKRALGIRVAARPDAGGEGRLTAEAVIARNLLRDVEVFIPLIFLLSAQQEMGVVNVAAMLWLAIFVFFPFTNRDALRAGDLVAGTWVVEAERRQLPQAMSHMAPPPGQEGAAYRFGETELSVYGEHELQVLEQVLRGGNARAQRQVMEAICRKIGWEAGHDDERAFLDAFYNALRAKLEGDMRFGKRKKDKHS